MKTFIKQLAVGLVLSIASLAGTSVSAQDNSDEIKRLETSMVEQGQWELLMLAPPKPFVTDGYPIFYDKSSVTKVNDNEYLVNLTTKKISVGKLWDTRLKTATYKVLCTERMFFLYGWVGAGMNVEYKDASKKQKISNKQYPLYQATCLN
jgi:hypothetical protein